MEKKFFIPAAIHCLLVFLLP